MVLNCKECNTSFPNSIAGLQKDICSKCLAIHCFSATEAVSEKPQCIGCGNMSSQLKQPLCNPCCKIFQQEDFIIPRAILANKAVYSQLFEPAGSPTKSGASVGVFERAAQYQQGSSTVRIGKTVCTGGNTGVNQNLEHANTAREVVRERHDKRDAYNTRTESVIIHAYVYMWPANTVQNKKKKMERVGDVTIRDTFVSDQALKQALSHLLKRIDSEHQKRYQDAAELDWSSVSLFFHGKTESSYTVFTVEEAEKLTVSGLFLRSRSLGYVTEGGKATERCVQIRFVYEEAIIFPHRLNGFGLGGLLLQSGMAGSSVARALSAAPSSFASGRKRKNSSALPPRSAPPNRRVALESAFVVPTATLNPQPPRRDYCRNPSMTLITFEKYIVTCNEGLTVEIDRQGIADDILELATDWKYGMGLADKDDFAAKLTGFIGSGFNKIAIYARYCDEEYAVARLAEDPAHTTSIQHEYLTAEFKLLAMANTMKNKFDEHARLCGVQGLPVFQVNFDGAFMGKVTTEADSTLPAYFLATRLLPCSSFDALKKFTGNKSVPPPTDAISKAIHAFAHYSLLYTKGYLVLCDLQGIYRDKVLHLIDPQCHTSLSHPHFKIYWNEYETGMQIFKDRHAVACRENDYCVQMNLCPTDDDVNATAEPKSAHKQRGKGKGKQRLVIQDLVI